MLTVIYVNTYEEQPPFFPYSLTGPAILSFIQCIEDKMAGPIMKCPLLGGLKCTPSIAALPVKTEGYVV